MPGRKLNKVEGAHEKCFCGTPIQCVKITYQGEDKLQWQNQDGSGAHFNPPGEDGKFTCNSTVKSEEPKSESPAGTITPQKAPENSILNDFEKIYRSGIPTAERIAREAILFGQPFNDKDVSVTTQCVMKSLIQYWIAKTK